MGSPSGVARSPAHPLRKYAPNFLATFEPLIPPVAVRAEAVYNGRRWTITMTDLLDDLQIRTARPTTAVVLGTRELGPEDVAVANAAPRAGESNPPLKRIRDRHHAIARCFASGMSNMQISAVTGMDPARVSLLRGDPSMVELTATYRAHVDAEFVDMHARMAALSADAVAELHTRLEDDPESFSISDLKDVAKTFADRTGFAPVQKSVSVNVNVGMASRLEEARRRAAEASRAVEAAE